MKDSGIPWVGLYPKHWENKRGKYLLHLLQRTVNKEDGVITCFRDGEVTLRSNRREEGFTIAEKECGYQGIDIGDLVVHGMDGFAGAIGISDSRGKASPVLNVLDSTLDKKYAMYYLRSLAYGNVFLALASGIRVRSCDLRWNKLSELRYPVPPYHEQQAIASFLDEKCTEIDALVEDIQAEINTLEELKKSIITEAVTKGLYPDAELKDSGITWVGKCPEHWEVKKIKYTVTCRSESALFIPDKDTYIGLENIVGWSNDVISSDTQYEQSIYSVCHKGDILYNKLRPNLGKAIIAPYDAFCTGELMVFSSFTGDKRFLRYWLINPILVNEVTMSTYGAKMPRANPNFIYNLPILIPPITEQQVIANYLDANCAEIEATITEKKEQLSTLAEYKKSLIYEYVTGKKEVPQK